VIIVASGAGGAIERAHHSPITRQTAVSRRVFPTISDVVRKKLPSVVKYRTAKTTFRRKN
jgi:hypothetical protein